MSLLVSIGRSCASSRIKELRSITNEKHILCLKVQPPLKLLLPLCTQVMAYATPTVEKSLRVRRTLHDIHPEFVHLVKKDVVMGSLKHRKSASAGIRINHIGHNAPESQRGAGCLREPGYRVSVPEDRLVPYPQLHLGDGRRSTKRSSLRRIDVK